ncbi:MAG: ATP-binding cassette domain-containing protein [Lachnospiraceae bacterium]|nr:ATP-binding cassette domain-containing protein [Lachnospiraceae bacterium]
MIEVREVSLQIAGCEILREINLELNEGKIYGLVGRNGSGKTMLMKCICGFIHPSSGEIISDGKVIGREMDYLEDAGIILEAPGFIPYYSGLRNLRLLADIHNRLTKNEVVRSMERVGLDPDLKLPVRKYSMGMRQRLGIAQAIMENPRILILDEPMNALDWQGVLDIRRLLLELKEDRIILIASHNREDIEILCDEVYEMEKGELLER